MKKKIKKRRKGNSRRQKISKPLIERRKRKANWWLSCIGPGNDWGKISPNQQEVAVIILCFLIEFMGIGLRMRQVGFRLSTVINQKGDQWTSVYSLFDLPLQILEVKR